jgi:hypothetical protein
MISADVVDLRFHRWARDIEAAVKTQSRLAADIVDLAEMGTDKSDRLATELAIEHFEHDEAWRHRFIGPRPPSEEA